MSKMLIVMMIYSCVCVASAYLSDMIAQVTVQNVSRQVTPNYEAS